MSFLTQVTPVAGTAFEITYVAMAAVVVIFAVVVFWNRSLQRHVAKKTAELNEELRNRALAEKALLMSQQRYATLFHAADDGLFLMDGERIVDSNPAAAKIFACPESNLVGKSPFDWSASYQPDGFDSHDTSRDILERVSQGESQSLEWLFKREDGEEFDAEVSLARCDTADKQYTLAIVRDISEQKRIDNLKDEFISTVSHEIRTPLTSILGSLKLVLSGELKGGMDQMIPMLGIAHNNAERLLALVNDLLDIQKLASKHSQLSYAETNIADFLKQAIANNQAYAERYEVKLVLEEVPDVYFALIDQGRLMQVMNNLLSNAAKFSSANGVVEVKTEEIGFMLRISVVDYGEGIAEEFHPHVFERFTQADSTSTRKVGGTGLGLNIAQSIVEQHGGQMSFISKPKAGSTFYFDIPFESASKKSQVS